MPLVHQAKLNKDSFWGIWQITESIQELAIDLVGAESITKSIALPQKQQESLAARQLCKHLLAIQGLEYRGLYKDEFGKPFLKDNNWQMSLSHSLGIATVLINRKQVVGIDIEQPRAQLRRVAPKFLSKIELDFSNDDLATLSLIWSAKEALYKLYGRKKLIFKEELSILPFVRAEEGGKFEAILRPKNQTNQRFDVYYQAWDDYWLAFVGV